MTDPINKLRANAEQMTHLAVHMKFTAACAELVKAIGPEAYLEFLDRAERKIARDLNAMIDTAFKPSEGKP